MKQLVIILLIITNYVAFSAQIEVDGSTCTLRNAINAAVSDSVVGGCTAGEFGHDVLNLSPNTTFTLTTSDPQESGWGLAIDDFSGITIEGNGSVIERDDSATDFGVLLVNNSPVTIKNLTIRNGHNINNSGGGIQAIHREAQLVLDHVNVIDNIGGGVFLVTTNANPNESVHQITHSRIANNSFAKSSVNVEPLSGAGLSVARTNVMVKNTTIDGNEAESIGGGISAFKSELFMINSTVSGNISGGSGGGIAVASGNNVIRIYASTISNNTSSSIGGGVNFNASESPSTFPNNYFRIFSSLIAGNVATLGANEIDGPVDQAVLLDGSNIIGENNVFGSTNIVLGTSDSVAVEAIDQIIQPLNSETDFKKTHNLINGSPAIDTGFCVSDYDQLDNNRPLDGDGDQGFSCDVGAIEFVPDMIFIDGFEELI